MRSKQGWRYVVVAVGLAVLGGCEGAGVERGVAPVSIAPALEEPSAAAPGASDAFSAMDWCWHPGAQVFTADFTGDGREELLCHDGSGHVWQAQATPEGTYRNVWASNMGFCNRPYTELHVGDFNGDGRADLLCHDSNTGDKEVAYADNTGRFRGPTWRSAMQWCHHRDAWVRVADFNGDGRTDLFCHDARGHAWVALADTLGRFPATSWDSELVWCTLPGDRLHVADFNGDRRADLLCQNTWSGRVTMAYADAAGGFRGTDWQAELGWCNQRGEQLHVGDFNGDGRADLLCHEASGHPHVRYADEAGRFTGTSQSGRANPLCAHAAGRLHVGRFDTDAKADLLCHDRANGDTWLRTTR